VGVVVAAVEEEVRCKAVLEGAGYRVEAAEQHGHGTFEMGGECDVERPRTCELEITLGVLQEMGEEAGVSTAEIDALETRPFTDDEAKRAAEAVVARLPDGEVKQDAESWIRACWGEDDGGSGS